MIGGCTICFAHCFGHEEPGGGVGLTTVVLVDVDRKFVTDVKSLEGRKCCLLFRVKGKAKLDKVSTNRSHFIRNEK